jgi:hypothetical protein
MAFKMSGWSAFTKTEKPPADETPEEAIKRLKKDKRHFQGRKAKAWLTGNKEEKEAMQGDIDDIKKLIEEQEIARDQDPGTGLNREDQAYQDIVDSKKQITEFKHRIKKDPKTYAELKNRGVDVIGNLTDSMNKNIKEWEALTGKKYGQGVF